MEMGKVIEDMVKVGFMEGMVMELEVMAKVMMGMDGLRIRAANREY